MPVTDESYDTGIPVEYEMTAQREDPRARPDGRFAQREVRARVFEALRGMPRKTASWSRCLMPTRALTVDKPTRRRASVSGGQAFQNLLRRLKTIRGRLSDELRGAALETMTTDGGAPVVTLARSRSQR